MSDRDEMGMWGGGPHLQGGPLSALCSALLGVTFDGADADRLYALVQTRPRAQRVQLRAFLRLVQFSTILRFPPARFSTLSQASREALVTRWLRHAPEFIRRGLAGLKSLAALAHYGDEKSWARLGYDGPWLGRKTIEVFPELVPSVTLPDRELELSADVCVIGTGAGGASAAALLTERGLKVIALEAGPRITAEDYNQRERDMLPLLYADAFLRTTANQAMGLLQGRGVGGSTLHNTGLVVPPPTGVLLRWAEHGLAYTAAGINAAADHVQKTLRAVPVVESRINRNNALLRSGAGALGHNYFIAQHNRLECSGCGYCMLGCAYNRKVNAAGAFLKTAVANGLTVIANTSVQRFSGSRDHFVVHGSSAAGAVRVRCRRIVVAASAIETPVLLRRSGARSGAIGSRLRLHPSAIVYARFAERVEAWRGVPQAVLVNAFASFEHDGRGGFLLLCNPANVPALVAVTAPGTGKQHHDLVGSYENLASAVVLVHDESHGRVVERGGRPVANYWLDENDRKTMWRGIHELARIYFAAGARAVYLPFDEGRACLEHELDLRMANARIEPHRLAMSSVHPQGSCPIGASSATSALDPYGQVWDTPGVYVADASVFPTSVGVPPQVAIMSLARLIADHVADELAA